MAGCLTVQRSCKTVYHAVSLRQCVIYRVYERGYYKCCVVCRIPIYENIVNLSVPLLPQNVACYGVNQPLPERHILRAGPLTLLYEAGDLRYIRLGEREIIRRIYAAVRDHNWGTAPAVLTDVKMDVRKDSFFIRYKAAHQMNDIDFRWTGVINGDANGTITFSLDGQAHSTFKRNRIGFCVLHPIRECAGTACRLERTDGSVVETEFPRLVGPQWIAPNGRPMPHGEFYDLRAMTHQVTPELWAEVHFEGDVFELEDQRNWIDASYKTYCTPLELPFPVEIQAGTRIQQEVRLALLGSLPQMDMIEDTPLTISILKAAPARRLPGIGVMLAQSEQASDNLMDERLRKLNLSHLRVALRLYESDWNALFERACLESQKLNLPLEMAMTISDSAEVELTALRAGLEIHQPQIARWIVLHQREMVTGEGWLEIARQHLASYAPHAPFGGGSKAYLAELNRARPNPETLDFISLTANPQVHAFDNLSIAETAAAFAPLLDTIASFSGGKPVVLSPITLRQEFNPVATGPEPEPPPGELPRRFDPRQMSLFGAGWTLAALKTIAEHGAAASVTFYETHGWGGVMADESGSSLPESFPSLPGCVYPVYHVLADVGAFHEGQVIPIQSSDPRQVEAMLLRLDKRGRLLIANLDVEPVTVQIELTVNNARLTTLDGSRVEMALHKPEDFRALPGTPIRGEAGLFSLTLDSYAVARLDFDEE